MKFLLSKTNHFLALLFILLVGVSGLSAQQNFGGVRGEVKDAQGASIPKATVTLINEGTKVSRSVVTNEAGIYVFGGVDPGTYKVTIAMPGFKSFATTGNTVSLGVTTTVDAALQIGATTDTVDVMADSLVLNTASASGGQLFSAKQVEDMPLLGRNPFMMEAFDANVVMLGDPRYVRAEDQTGSSQVSLAGAPSNSNSYVVDGIPISTSSGGVTFIPTIESVENAKIQSNTYDAEIGRSGGGVFASNLKAGTSQYHGVLYGETRQTPWSGNVWFNFPNTAGQKAATPSDTTYIYEGGIGGPLFPNWLKKPHWLDNTFFWIDEAGYRQGQPLTGVTTAFYVPTPAERTGDFSADTAYPLYDPTQRAANGTDACRLSALGDCGVGGPTDTLNVIPASYKNAIGLYTANAFPGVTATTTYGSGANFSNPVSSFKSRDDTYSGKLEHTFAPWYTASASYVHSAIQEPSGNALIVPFANSNKLLRYTDATAINNTFTVNPTTLLTVAYGFNRYYSASFQYTTGFNASNGFGGAGFSQGFTSLLQSPTFPTITLSGISSGGAAGLGSANAGPTVYASHNLVVSASKIINRHSVKAGYAYRAFDVYTNPTSGGNGSFTFNGQYSNATGTTNTNSPGAIADLIMGLPSGASLTVNSGVFINAIGYHAVFAQDDFRINEKLTVNYGLRYEYEQGQYEKSNRYNVGFDPNATATYTGGTALAPTTVNVKGGVEFAGKNGYPIHCCDNSHVKFSPRIGISYAPTRDTVVHAGFGVFFAPVGIAAATSGYSQPSSYSPGSAVAATPGTNAYLSNPFPSGVALPTGSSLGALTNLGQPFTGSSTYAFTTGLQDDQKRVPFVDQYSLDVQHQFPKDVLVKVGYYGAHARNFANYTNINQIPDSVLASYAPGGSNAAGLSATNNLSTKVANPYYSGVYVGGLPPQGVVQTPTVAKGQLLLPFPQFQQVFVLRSSGYSNYNSLVVKVEKRMTKGLTVLGTYTWASNWDNIWSTGSQVYSTYGPQDAYNPKGEYARSLNSIPDRATAAITYDLPVGKGQKFLGSPQGVTGKIVDELVGGWQINDEWIDQNGVPVSIVQTNLSAGTYGTNGIGGTYQRPNIGPGGLHAACPAGSAQGRLGNYGTANGAALVEKAYINPAAFTAALPYTYGNTPRTLPCRQPGYDNQNISLFKDFTITEKVHFQFRAELLNAFNTPEFGQPSTTLGITPVTANGANPLTTTPTTNGYPVGGTANQAAQSLGNITTTIGFARIIQLGGRLSF